MPKSTTHCVQVYAGEQPKCLNVNFTKSNTYVNYKRIELVESIPEGLVFPEGSPKFISTYDAWINLIKMAEHKIDIATFYWTLLGMDDDDSNAHPSTWQGSNIFKSLLVAGTKRKIKIRLVQSAASDISSNIEADMLAKQKAAEIRSVDFRKLLGGGVLHTKLWIVDDQHMYVGSANNDWRALTQVCGFFVIIEPKNDQKMYIGI